MPWSFKWSVAFKFSHQNLVYIYHISYVHYMLCASDPPWFNHPNKIQRIIQIINSHQAAFTSFLLVIPCYIQIFYSAACPHTPSVYVLHLMCGTKFHMLESFSKTKNTKYHILSQWDLRFSQRWIRRWLSSGLLHHVVWYKSTEVSEMLAASIIITLMMEAASNSEKLVNF
jgi:hypothetical protein